MHLHDDDPDLYVEDARHRGEGIYLAALPYRDNEKVLVIDGHITLSDLDRLVTALKSKPADWWATA